ncbi:hypothetical protein LA6_003891 [Marinibacterium anthonyi]|nr:hypothetical protein LA6_003891 [Marinibacterium anthonyi]
MGLGGKRNKGWRKSGGTPIFDRAQPIGIVLAGMNVQSDLSMKTDEVLRVELEVFRRQHRDLDEAIRALEDRGTGDQLTIRRLKKQKLHLKDTIALIEDRLTPDIIA